MAFQTGDVVTVHGTDAKGRSWEGVQAIVDEPDEFETIMRELGASIGIPLEKFTFLRPVGERPDGGDTAFNWTTAELTLAGE